MLLLALAAFLWTLRGTVAPAALIVAAVVVSGALAAGTAMMWLDAASVLDNARAVPANQSRDTFAESISVEAEYGTVIWFAAAGAACAGAGAVLSAWHRRVRRTSPADVPPPEPGPRSYPTTNWASRWPGNPPPAASGSVGANAGLAR